MRVGEQCVGEGLLAGFQESGAVHEQRCCVFGELGRGRRSPMSHRSCTFHLALRHSCRRPGREFRASNAIRGRARRALGRSAIAGAGRRAEAGSGSCPRRAKRRSVAGCTSKSAATSSVSITGCTEGSGNTFHRLAQRVEYGAVARGVVQRRFGVAALRAQERQRRGGYRGRGRAQRRRALGSGSGDARTEAEAEPLGRLRSARRGPWTSTHGACPDRYTDVQTYARQPGRLSLRTYTPVKQNAYMPPTELPGSGTYTDGNLTARLLLRDRRRPARDTTGRGRPVPRSNPRRFAASAPPPDLVGERPSSATSSP